MAENLNAGVNSHAIDWSILEKPIRQAGFRPEFRCTKHLLSRAILVDQVFNYWARLYSYSIG